MELDKNVGSAVISNELFDKLTLDLLNDSLTYDYLDYDPLLSIKK